MNNRRKFLAAGGALAALAVLPAADADQPRAYSIYLHGMVWNRQLAARQNDWLVRLDAKADRQRPRPRESGICDPRRRFS